VNGGLIVTVTVNGAPAQPLSPTTLTEYVTVTGTLNGLLRLSVIKSPIVGVVVAPTAANAPGIEIAVAFHVNTVACTLVKAKFRS
jgi:hypothetical protein